MAITCQSTCIVIIIAVGGYVTRKSKKGIPQCTPEQVERRLVIVARMVLDGWSADQIHQYVNGNRPADGDNPGWESWNIAPRTTREYIARCRQNWAADTGERAEMLAESMAKLDDLYRLAYAQNKIADCRAIQRDKDDLQGFYKFRVDLGKVELKITEAPKPGEEGSRV